MEIKYFVSIDWFNSIESDLKKKMIRKKYLGFIFGKIDFNIFSSTNNKRNLLIFDWIQISIKDYFIYKSKWNI